MRESSDFELTDTENKTDEIREFLWKNICAGELQFLSEIKAL